jgi:hypothetical protein
MAIKSRFILGLALLLTASALAQSGPGIGEFTIQNPGGETVLQRTRKTGVVQVTLTGPRLAIKSARVDFAGRKLWVRAAGTPARATNGTASGGARIILKNAQSGQSDVLTCERAEFTAGAAPRSGHIDLIGKVTWKVLDKAQRVIAQANSDGGEVDFDDEGETIRLGSTSGSLMPQKKGGS